MLVAATNARRSQVLRRRHSVIANPASIENTTLVCVATNARLDHHALQRVAYQAHDGLARTIAWYREQTPAIA